MAGLAAGAGGTGCALVCIADVAGAPFISPEKTSALTFACKSFIFVSITAIWSLMFEII
jgi:hypothetical protein